MDLLRLEAAPGERRPVRRVGAHGLGAGHELLGMDGGLHVGDDAETGETAGVDVDSGLQAAPRGGVEQDRSHHARRPLAAGAPALQQSLRRLFEGDVDEADVPDVGRLAQDRDGGRELVGRERVERVRDGDRHPASLPTASVGAAVGRSASVRDRDGGALAEAPDRWVSAASPRIAHGCRRPIRPAVPVVAGPDNEAKGAFMRTIPTLVSVAAAALVLVACGGGDSADSTAADDGTPAPGASTVSLKGVDGLGQVLVDAGGQALYAADEESDGSVLCVDSCTSLWRPLEAGPGDPSGADGVGTLGVVLRPDGMRQVTVEGRPLYTFTQEEPGQVTGNGLADAFGDRSFTWHAALADGASASGGSTSQAPSRYGD